MGLGVAIGPKVLRACLVAPWWRNFWLRWCAARPLPQDLITPSPSDENIASVARFHEVLADLFQGLWFPRRLRVGLPDGSVRVRLLFADSLPEDPAECRKYLFWRLADVLDVRPDRTRLAWAALPSPLPRHRHAVLCAVSADKVIQQYERALTESRVRCSGLAPSSVLLFTLFRRQLMAPPGVPLLFVASTEATVTTALILNGSPIFWRTRPVARPPEPPGQPVVDHRRGGLLRDMDEAMVYCRDALEVEPPARILITGPSAAGQGLAGWLGTQWDLPVDDLDARRLVGRPLPRDTNEEGWDGWGVALGAAARR